MAIEIDLTEYDTGKPHWLSPHGERFAARRAEITAKHRERHLKLRQAERILRRITGRTTTEETKTT